MDLLERILKGCCSCFCDCVSAVLPVTVCSVRHEMQMGSSFMLSLSCSHCLLIPGFPRKWAVCPCGQVRVWLRPPSHNIYGSFAEWFNRFSVFCQLFFFHGQIPSEIEILSVGEMGSPCLVFKSLDALRFYETAEIGTPWAEGGNVIRPLFLLFLAFHYFAEISDVKLYFIRKPGGSKMKYEYMECSSRHGCGRLLRWCGVNDWGNRRIDTICTLH